ncbi:thiol:disulfide interchange protein DsbA/DsbL [Gammaproteobacteria bacterium]|jgi:thiol:disulfide interchange protein DsbA|nr:thiol:disulfide interchange protein DsbA/DsbL [Gammaproteobacteria bacterium]|tara:strand:- start:517 stop:1128 length:612 start_codon:yes stop_codon:yes gene_type:complete
MLKIKYLFLAIFLIIITSPNVFAQKYVQISTEKQQESKSIIIYEFFWYGCPHCYNLEPTMERIEADLDKDTKIVKLPVALRDSWIPHAKLFYALQQMGKIDEVHNLIFEEIHLEDNRLNTEQQMVDFLGKHGIDTNKFMEKYNSFGTEARIKKASNLAKKYQINSVPTIIVNGKYLTSGSYVSSYDELYSVINLLIERERNDL